MSENTTLPRTSGLAAPQTPPERPQQRVPEAAVGEGELQGIRASSNPGRSPNQQASGFRHVRGCGKVYDVRKGRVAGSRGASGGCRSDVMSTAWRRDPQESGRVGRTPGSCARVTSAGPLYLQFSNHSPRKSVHNHALPSWKHSRPMEVRRAAIFTRKWERKGAGWGSLGVPPACPWVDGG